jgi:ribosomal protein S18 acetylase RimI-like enzyme
MIEPGTIEDLDALTELWVALAEDQRDHGSHVLGEENHTVVRQSLSEKVVDDSVFVARDDGAIVGFVSVGLEDGSFERDVRRGIVENVYVKADHRDRGIGTRLIERAEQELARRDVDVVSLEVLVENDSARTLYETRDYSPHRVELEKRLGSDNH